MIAAPAKAERRLLKAHVPKISSVLGYRKCGPLRIQPFGEDDLTGAARTAQKFAGQKLTLADAHGLALMRERRIHICWSTDRHLGLTGVPLII